jgi:hypothetical protein
VSRPPAAAAALVAALALAACGQQANGRPRVARYIGQVNRIETALTAPLTTISQISAAVAGSARHPLTTAGAEVRGRQLVAALAQIEAGGRRLRDLAAPSAAGGLRALLLRYTSDEAALTRQLELLVGFLPRFTRALGPLGPALAALERALTVHQASGSAAVAAVYRAKAAALRRFERVADGIAGRVARLSPPAVSRPAYTAQLRSLRGMSASAGRLAAALAGGAPGDVTPLLVAFDRAALATRSRAAQKAEIAAVRSYDARSSQLTSLADAIARERFRLAAILH